MQQIARRHHMTCLVNMRKFWHYLLEPVSLNSKLLLLLLCVSNHYV